jgi:hypothetical protein
MIITPRQKNYLSLILLAKERPEACSNRQMRILHMATLPIIAEGGLETGEAPWHATQK